MHLGVAILRVENGLDYSRILGEEAPTVFNEPRTIIQNDSTADLLSSDKVSNFHGSSDSLSRNVSQGFYIFFIFVFKSCTSDYYESP